METDIQTRSATPFFGARAAAVILLQILIACIVADILLVTLLNSFESFLVDQSEEQVAALRTTLLGLLNPTITILVILLRLRKHFADESIGSIFLLFGLERRPSLRIFVASFGVGMLFVFAFMALMKIFPPDISPTPHPDNVINQAPFFIKLVFAVSAITIVPLAEESLFRGVLYQGFAASWGKVVSAICVSAIFVLLHPNTIGSGYWLTHLALYLFPFLLILLREMMKTLYASVAAHSAFNFTEIFF